MLIQYREPLNSNELEALFRLRHLVYSEDAHLNSMIQKTSPYDINGFDLQSLHFGAFENGKAIAYIRITTVLETHFTKWVKEILFKNNIATKTSSSLFPFQSYYPDLNWGIDFISSLEGRKTGEVGKLAIHKDYRKAGVILSGLIESFIDYCKNEQKIETGFGSCALKLARYYRKFGFTPASGAKSFIYEKLPEAVIMRFDK